MSAAAGEADPTLSSPDDLALAIEACTLANRARPERRLEEQLIELREARFLAADRTLNPQDAPDIAAAPPVDPDVGLPVLRGPPDPRTVGAAIAAHGSVLVRQLLSPESAVSLRETAEAALAARDRANSGALPSDGAAWHSEFPRLREPFSRHVTEGMLAVDSPHGLYQLLEALRAAGVDRLAREVLGAEPAFAAEKTVFRRVTPSYDESMADFGWHQDGAFLGERIRTLDVWIALSPCGRHAPGLEILPRRVDRVLPSGAFHSWDLSRRLIANVYPDFSTVQPEFAPGDAMLFDQLCVHRSGHAPGMTDTRLAIECWLFAPGGFPPAYAGLML